MTTLNKLGPPVIKGWMNRRGAMVPTSAGALVALCLCEGCDLAWPVAVAKIPVELRVLEATLPVELGPTPSAK